MISAPIFLTAIALLTRRIRERWHKTILPVLPFLLVATVYVLMTVWFYPSFRNADERLRVLVSHPLELVQGLTTYLQELAVPWEFLGRSYSFWNPKHHVPWIAAALAVLTGFVLVRLRSLAPRLGLVWILAATAPFLHVRAGVPTKERYLYIPLMGMCLLLAWILLHLFASARAVEAQRNRRWPKTGVTLLFCALLACLLAGRLDRAAAWHENTRIVTGYVDCLRRAGPPANDPAVFYLVYTPYRVNRVRTLPVPGFTEAAILGRKAGNHSLPKGDRIFLEDREAGSLKLKLYRRFALHAGSSADRRSWPSYEGPLFERAGQQRKTVPFDGMNLELRHDAPRVILLYGKQNFWPITEVVLPPHEVVVSHSANVPRLVVEVRPTGSKACRRHAMRRRPGAARWETTLSLRPGFHELRLLDGDRTGPWRRLHVPNLALPLGLWHRLDESERQRFRTLKQSVTRFPGKPSPWRKLIALYLRKGCVDESDFEEECLRRWMTATNRVKRLPTIPQ